MDCLFCKIIHKDIKSEIIYEDEEILTFLDINPVTKGHSLVVSKQHAAALTDLDDDSILSLFKGVQKSVIILKSSLKPDGFTIGINHGRAAGQAVEHLHIHIIPRWENDGGSSLHSVVKKPPSESLAEIAAIIKKSQPVVQQS